VSPLTFSSKEAVRNLKQGEKATKVYRAIVEFASKLPKMQYLNRRIEQ